MAEDTGSGDAVTGRCTQDYAERRALAAQTATLAERRRLADEAGMPQWQAAPAAMLATLAAAIGATSAIVVGTGAIVESLEITRGMGGRGMLTAVDSSAEGVALLRDAFCHAAAGTSTTLRAVNASARDFLPRLNGADYDLIAVSGDVANYAPAFAQAPRLLRGHGLAVFGDVLSSRRPCDDEGREALMRDFLDRVDEDDRFVSSLVPVGSGMLIATMR